MKLTPDAKNRLTEFLAENLKPECLTVRDQPDLYEAELDEPTPGYTETLELPAHLTVSGHTEAWRYGSDDVMPAE